MDDIETKARRHYPAEGSHGWNHIQDVLANAKRMRRRELLKKELAAIMYHDSSLMTGDRETHADDSAEIARKELAGLFRKRQLVDIVNAIAHHRASYEGRRSSRLEDLVAAADRPVPDLAKQVARSWKYHEELGEPEDLRSKNVASHLKEKYGHGGYAYGNAPKLYLKTYGRELRDIMSKFDALTPETVASMMSGVPEKKAEAKDIGFPKDEIEGLAGRDSIVTHRVSDDAGKYDAGDIVKSPWGDRYEVSDRKDVSKVEDSPYYKYLTDGQKALLKVYDRIAVLRLKRQEKKASIKSPEDLDELYSRLKYRVLNKDTNRPFFNTKFETFDKWHLLSPEQIKKHRIGICYDTAAMTDKVLGDLGVEHRNYFAHSDKADSWENDPTHAFNVYKDKDGNWRWLEGSWGKYKGNDWKEKSRKRLVKRIVKALADESGEKQKLHEVGVFPAPGTSMRDWYDAMSKMPVKKADDKSERLAKACEEQSDIS